MKQALMDFFSKLFDLLFSQVKLPQTTSLSFRNYQILRTARAEIGTTEVPGPKNNNRVVKYHAYATIQNKRGQNDSVPWCSSFCCFVAETTMVKGKPIGSPNSMAARSWLNWGVSVKGDPMPGDVVVYWRGSRDGWQGHVGFWVGENKSSGKIYTLGGNQRDRVSVAAYSKVKLLDIRRSSKHRKINEKEKAALWDFADEILRENGVQLGGKVT